MPEAKRFTIVTLGTRGDVQPHIALGAALHQAGHRVRVATSTTFAGLVGGQSLTFQPLSVDPRLMMEVGVGKSRSRRSRNPISTVLKFRRSFKALLLRAADETLVACQDSDGIIFSSFGFLASHVAEALNIPAVETTLQPMARTRAFPSPWMPYLPARIGALNLLSHRIVEWMLWLPIRGTVNQWRRGAGLPVRGHPSPPGARRPFLAAFSPSIIPRPPDWTAGIHIAGYWFLDGRRDWQPPDGLVAFLAARPRPIYIGFGSNVERRPEKLTGLVLDALERTGSRAVLTTGWGALSERASEAAQISKRVYVAEDIPHDWLLPQVRAAIHHGGAGTTAACFRAGIPQVIVPFFTPDQWYWSYRVRSTGVGFGPVRRQGLSSQRLAKALDRVLASQRIQETAAKVGAKIRAEDGLGWTTNFLASYVDSS